MDQLTLSRIKLAHPNIRKELEQYYLECNNLLPKGVRLRFSHVYRSIKEQDALFNQRPKVTNARGGQSMHNYGTAFDYVILLDKDNNGTFETIECDLKSPYHKVVWDYFKSKGYEHGGDWKRFKDYPHFQKTFGYTWQQLKKKVDSGDIIRVDNIVYPRI